MNRCTAFAAVRVPIPNVRFHGESWRVSRRATEIAKTTFMTQAVIGPTDRLQNAHDTS
jgi:hypothetical protein